MFDILFDMKVSFVGATLFCIVQPFQIVKSPLKFNSIRTCILNCHPPRPLRAWRFHSF